MENNKIQEAKKLLQDNGYQVANLWNIVDVQDRFNCTDEEALKVLESALTNEATMEQIWFAINLIAENNELKPI
jgi:muramoyltetrapeptide carboxypeptidase LdcA involved in peptidoglycan recycling